MRTAAARMAAFDRLHPPAEQFALEWLERRVRELGLTQACFFALLQYLDDSLLTSLNDALTASGVTRGECHAYLLDAAMEEAGIAMAGGKKKVESEGEVEGLGVCVCPARWAAFYPPEKAVRLKAFMEAVIARAVGDGLVSKLEVESLVGVQKWVAQVAPQVAPLLASGYKVAYAKSAAEKVSPSATFVADQRKVLQILESKPEVPLVPRAAFPAIASHRVALQDACEDGMGGVCLEGGVIFFFIEAWPQPVLDALHARPRQLYMSTAELFAARAWVQRLCETLPHDPHFTDFTDNEAARGAATKGTSKSLQMAPLAEALDRYMADVQVALRTRRVTTKENKMADELSRGECGALLRRARELGHPARRLRFAPDDELWAELTCLTGVGVSGK